MTQIKIPQTKAEVEELLKSFFEKQVVSIPAYLANGKLIDVEAKHIAVGSMIGDLIEIVLPHRTAVISAANLAGEMLKLSALHQRLYRFSRMLLQYPPDWKEHHDQIINMISRCSTFDEIGELEIQIENTSSLSADEKDEYCGAFLGRTEELEAKADAKTTEAPQAS